VSLIPTRGGPACTVRPAMTPQESDRPDACSGRRQGILPAGMRFCWHCDTAPDTADPSRARHGPPRGGTVG
jgi:hypothetical protein